MDDTKEFFAIYGPRKINICINLHKEGVTERGLGVVTEVISVQ